MKKKETHNPLRSVPVEAQQLWGIVALDRTTIPDEYILNFIDYYVEGPHHLDPTSYVVAGRTLLQHCIVPSSLEVFKRVMELDPRFDRTDTKTYLSPLSELYMNEKDPYMLEAKALMMLHAGAKTSPHCKDDRLNRIQNRIRMVLPFANVPRMPTQMLMLLDKCLQ